MDAALEAYDPARAGRALSGLIDDLSNWYVRRSRRRFWDGDPAALQTLHDCLDVLTRLLAPFVPFVTERVWQALFAEATGVASVHLASWPDTGAPTDRELSAQVALVRRVVADLSQEVLAVALTEGAPAQPDGFFAAGDDELGLQLWLTRLMAGQPDS